MRITVDIDKRLMREAMLNSKISTQKGAIEAGLRLLIQTHGQATIRRLRGKVLWRGDLTESRLGRITE